jgi:hypothetical protein
VLFGLLFASWSIMSCAAIHSLLTPQPHWPQLNTIMAASLLTMYAFVFPKPHPSLFLDSRPSSGGAGTPRSAFGVGDFIADAGVVGVALRSMRVEPFIL